jgi:hypothetical protein
MSSRILAASIIVIGVGTMVTPVETSAAGSAPLVAAPIVTPGARPPVAALPFAHRFVPRTTGAFPMRMDGFRRASRLGERLGAGFPLGWDYGSPYPGYYPYGAPEYAAPYGPYPYPYPPMENFSERSRPVVARPPECHTDTQKVPSESGGERTINITRCY